MLTPSANFTNAFKNSDVFPVFIIYITIGNTTYGYVSGQKPIFGYDPVVMDVSHGAPEIDIVDRSMTVGSFSITFAPDNVFRDLFVANRLPGRKVVIKLGTYQLDEVDFFQPYPPLMVKDIQPSIDKIVLECEDFTSIFSDRHVGQSSFISQHPFSCISTILSLAGITSTYIDTDALDPLHIDNDDITHHTISRLSTKDPIELDNGFKERYQALNAINELCDLTRSTFHVNTDGKFSIRRYSSLRGVDRHIPQEKIIGFTQGTLAENLANEIIFTLAERTVKQASRGGWDPLIVDTKHTTTWGKSDINSQLTQTPIGTVERIVRQEHSSAWLNGASRIFYPLPNSVASANSTALAYDATSFVLPDAGLNGFAGCKHKKPTSLSSFIQNTSYDLSNSKPAYILIEGTAISSANTSLSVDHNNGATSITLVNPRAFRNGNVVTIGTSVGHTLSNNIGNTYDISPALVGNQAAGSTVQVPGNWIHRLEREVISCNDVTIDYESDMTQLYIPEPGYTRDFHDYAHHAPIKSRFHIYQRGLFGTSTPLAWDIAGPQIEADGSLHTNKALAWDITIPVLVTTEALTRFTNGAPRFRVRLPLSELDIEFGDFLTFSYDKFYMFGKSSLDSTSVFEVLKVEHQITGPTPGVYLDVAWVRNNLSYTPNLQYQNIVPMPYSRIGVGPIFILDNNGDPVFIDTDNLISI